MRESSLARIFKFGVCFLLLPIILSACTYLSAGCRPPPLTQSGEIDGMQSGCFDIYLLALVWKPEYCTHVANYNCSALYHTYTMKHFGIHGLWPQFYRRKATYPAYCLGSPGGSSFDQHALTQVTWHKYLMLAPIGGANLATHEWEKHGVCSGLTQEQYFKAIVNKAMKSPGTPVAFKAHIGKSLSYRGLAKLFGGVESVQLDCDYDENSHNYYLSSVITFWDKRTGRQLKNPGIKSTCAKKKLIYIRAVPVPLARIFHEKSTAASASQSWTALQKKK